MLWEHTSNICSFTMWAETSEGPTPSLGTGVAGWAWPFASRAAPNSQASVLLSFSWGFTRGRPAPR